jgi:Tfp pilus assembly major pilin PilA
MDRENAHNNEQSQEASTRVKAKTRIASTTRIRKNTGTGTKTIEWMALTARIANTIRRGMRIKKRLVSGSHSHQERIGSTRRLI